jgi:hypothetical protein
LSGPAFAANSSNIILFCHIYIKKIKEGFVLRTICGQNVISGEGLDQVNFSKLISLNDTATFLWKVAQDGDFTEEDLVSRLLEEYEVEQEVAAKDVHAMISQWRELGLVED